MANLRSQKSGAMSVRAVTEQCEEKHGETTQRDQRAFVQFPSQPKAALNAPRPKG